MELEFRITLTKKQSEFDKAVERFPVVFFGGAKGGGKSFGLRSIILKRRFTFPGSTGAIFRRTYPELYANHISPLLTQFPALREYYNEGRKILSLPNGSSIHFCHCANEKDISLYQGREFHDLGIEEVGQWTEQMFRTLHGSNRSGDPRIPARTLLTGNPGGVGHGFLKRLFIERRFNDRENPSDYYFVQSKIADNPALLKSDPKYVERLQAEPNEMLRRAYLHGDWDVAAGQYFSEFSRDVHVVEPFTIPPHWKWFGAYDYGYNHPAAWLFFVTDEDGNVYLVHEIVKAQMRIDEQATIVKEFISKMIETNQKADKSIVFEAGHDCWAKKKASDPTIAEDFSKLGVILRRANINRKLGASQIRMYLAHDKASKKAPRLFIFKNCEITIDCISRMIHNPSDIEDVLKVDSVDGDPWTGDDAYDAARMALMSRPVISVAPKPKRRTSYDEAHDNRPSWQTV